MRRIIPSYVYTVKTRLYTGIKQAFPRVERKEHVTKLFTPVCGFKNSPGFDYDGQHISTKPQ